MKDLNKKFKDYSELTKLLTENEDIVVDNVLGSWAKNKIAKNKARICLDSNN